MLPVRSSLRPSTSAPVWEFAVVFRDVDVCVVAGGCENLEQEFETRVWIRNLDHEFRFSISASKLSASKLSGIYFNAHAGENGYNISAVSSVRNLVA